MRRWIHRHNRCLCITILRLGRRQVELVFAPHGEVIEPHVHQQADCTLVILGGEMEGTIADRKGKTGWYDFLRRFKIPAGVTHSATVTGRFVLFANFERWLTDPTSAAIDFKSS